MMIFAAALLASCSADDKPMATAPMAPGAEGGREALRSRLANPREAAGRIHGELLSAYYAAHGGSQDAAAVAAGVRALAVARPDWESLCGTPCPDIAARAAALLADNRDWRMRMRIAGMTATGGRALEDFASGLMEGYESGWDAGQLGAYIDAFEQGLPRAGLADFDETVIWNVSAVARSAAEAARKRPKKKDDPEWDLLIANLVGAAHGAAESSAAAAELGLVLGIVGQPARPPE